MSIDLRLVSFLSVSHFWAIISSYLNCVKLTFCITGFQSYTLSKDKRKKENIEYIAFVQAKSKIGKAGVLLLTFKLISQI